MRTTPVLKSYLAAFLTDGVAGSRSPGTVILCNEVSNGCSHSESGSRAERASAGRTDLAAGEIINYVPREGRLPGNDGGGGVLVQPQVEHVPLLVLERKLFEGC